MFSKDEEKHLIRLLGRNEVILFLGSGFSLDANNKSGEKFPAGWALGEKIWKFLGYTEAYDDTPLPQMYQAFLNPGKKKQVDKIEFLNRTLLSSSVPDLYNAITIPYWYKIYTLNIDDILDVVYKRNNKSLQNLCFPKDEFKERDQSLEKCQCTYLHGKLPCLPEEVIFSTKQYAQASLVKLPLYSQFTYDYATTTTIFIGTELDESLFENFIESRQGKVGYAELRPKSYLITPTLKPIKKETFKTQYNVHHIEGTTSDFLNWLQSIQSQLPTKNDILRTTFPNLLNIYDFAKLTDISKSTVSSFAMAFDRIPREYKIKDDRSAFLLGATPSWNDIYKELDIPRTITSDALELISTSLLDTKTISKQQMFTFLGSAGSGKTTILKRLGLRLTQDGRTVFICNTESLPKADLIFDVLNVIEEKVIIIFDEAKNILKDIPVLVSAFSKLKNPPLLILGLRKNSRHKLNYFLDPNICDNFDIEIPDLDDDEIKNLIIKLDENNYLGVLKGMTDNQRFHEFKFRAKKQILIAMKEATKGQPFDQIIKAEFNEIDPFEARLLAVCISLNTEQGFSNSPQDFLGFANVVHSEALNYLNFNLNGIIIWDDLRTSFMIRHAVLADYIIKNCSDQAILKEAYIRVLNVLSPELKKKVGQHIRKFNLYKALINHHILYQRFKEDITQAREVYDSIVDAFNDDAHYWLQYGSLEMTFTGGDLGLAEHYISQAESLAPGYNIVLTTKCLLYYKLSVTSDDSMVGYSYKIMADTLAESIIASDANTYIHHIQCMGIYGYIVKWSQTNEEKLIKIKELRKKISSVVIQNPRDRDLDAAKHLIDRAYFRLGAGLDMIDELD